MNHPFAQERKLFPLLERKAQLSSCSQSALCTPVSEAIASYMASWSEKGMDWVAWGVTLEQAKADFARLINADAADIAVMSSVSDLASSLGNSLSYEGGRNAIVLGEIEFPSLGHVWLAQQARGAVVRFVQPNAAGEVEPADFERVVDEQTRLVSVSHVAYANGFKMDIAAIARLAHERGALVFVDAYQSMGSMRIDVVRDGIDVLVCGAQKYLLGCPGIAFMYIRRDLAEQLRPANTGWFGRVNPFAFDIHTLDYAQGARRFDTGTPPYINGAAAGAGMALLNQLDMALVEAWIEHLSAVAVAAADRHGLSVASPRDPRRKGSTTAIRVKDSAAVEKKVAELGFILSARGQLIRVAPHFYNTEQEIAGAMEALARVV